MIESFVSFSLEIIIIGAVIIFWFVAVTFSVLAAYKIWAWARSRKKPKVWRAG